MVHVHCELLETHGAKWVYKDNGFLDDPPPMTTNTNHSSPIQPTTHPSSRDTTTMTTTTMTTCRTPFEYWLVCSVVKFSDAFFTDVKSQSVIFSQMFFSG